MDTLTIIALIIIGVVVVVYLFSRWVVNGIFNFFVGKYDERTDAIRHSGQQFHNEPYIHHEHEASSYLGHAGTYNHFYIKNEPKPTMIRKKISRVTEDGNKEIEEVIEDY